MYADEASMLLIELKKRNGKHEKKIIRVLYYVLATQLSIVFLKQSFLVLNWIFFKNRMIQGKKKVLKTLSDHI